MISRLCKPCKSQYDDNLMTTGKRECLRERGEEVWPLRDVFRGPTSHTCRTITHVEGLDGTDWMGQTGDWRGPARKKEYASTTPASSP